MGLASWDLSAHMGCAGPAVPGPQGQLVHVSKSLGPFLKICSARVNNFWRLNWFVLVPKVHPEYPVDFLVQRNLTETSWITLLLHSSGRIWVFEIGGALKSLVQ